MQTTSPGTLVQHAIEEPATMETEDNAPTVVYDRQEEIDMVYNNTLDERYTHIWWKHFRGKVNQFLAHLSL